MGFSLERFFEELKQALLDVEKGQLHLSDVEYWIRAQEQYAKDCGQIK